jgi:DNA-binding transcriptional regulator YbjK
MRDRVDRVSHRRRGAESTVELLLDVLVGPVGDEPAREQLIARFERSVACARNPELRGVQRQLRGQLDDVVADVLRRSGRTARPDQLRHLVATVDGATVHALADYTPTPRVAARDALLQLIDIVAPNTDNGVS